MTEIKRFGVSINEKLIKDFDRLIEKKGYANRSEAIRDLIRDELVAEEWKQEDRETVGTITLVYSHDIRELSDTLTDLQHSFYRTIISTLHVHLDEHNCLEVLVLKGKSGKIREIADRIIGTRGVKHGKLSLTTTGVNLE
ncbi:MAG: nickel-responsive transcriptional regulator NikR [Fidelibacterota bacterium]